MLDLIISAPYYSDNDYEIHSNIYEASMMAKYYWKLGYNVFCPHMNTAFFGGLIDESQFLLACIERIKKADVVAFHPRWKYSSGCQKEHMAAIDYKIKKEYPLLKNFMKRF